jgi:hypothetical protein
MTVDPTPAAPKPARRWLSVENVSLGILIVITVLVVGLVAWVAFVQQPAFTYSSPVYQPAASVLCPDDELAYTNTVTISKLPLTPFTVHSWWSVDEGHSVGPGSDLAFVVWTENTPRLVTRALTVTVPALAPGNYEYRVGASAGGTLGTYTVPFQVPPDCHPSP